METLNEIKRQIESYSKKLDKLKKEDRDYGMLSDEENRLFADQLLFTERVVRGLKRIKKLYDSSSNSQYN